MLPSLSFNTLAFFWECCYTGRTPSPAQDSDVALGSIVAGVLVPIFLIATVVGVVVLLFVLHKLQRKKQLKRMQLDIHAV